MSENKNHAQKYHLRSCLILKLGAIGDVAMATAVLTALREATPDVRITWVVGDAARPVLEATGLVDEVICARDQDILHGSLMQKFRAVRQIQRELSGRSFDLCLIPYRDRRYHLLRMGVRCRCVRSFAGARALIPGRYHPYEYARLAAGREVSSAKPLSLARIKADEKFTEDVPHVLLAVGSPDSSATDWMRQWPLESYATLARMLCDHGLSVGIVGTDGTGKVEDAFRRLPVTSYINKTPLPRLLQLLCRTRLLVCHDTGTMHLRALCGGPCLSLFGPTLAQEKVFPSECNVVLRCSPPLPCMPCYDGKTYSECRNRPCMRRISPEQVLEAALRMLEASSPTESTREKA